MVAFVCLAINLTLLLIDAIVYKNVLAPPVLLNILWGAVNALNLALGWNSNEFAYLILALPPLMFNIGFLAATQTGKWQPLNAKEAVIGSEIHYRKKTMYLLIILVIAVACVYFYFVYNRISMYYQLNWWYTLRRIVWLEGTKDIALFTYPGIPVMIMPTVLCFFLRFDKSRRTKLYFFVSLVIALIWSILSTSRTTTFIVLCMLAMSQVVFYMDNPKDRIVSDIAMRKRNRRLLSFSAVVILVVFLVVAFQKSSGTYGNVSGVVFALKNLSNYSNLSSACFVEWFNGGFELKHGLISFRLLYVVLERLGLPVTVLNTTSGGVFYTYHGYTTNALTVARNYIEDFGVVYMAGMLFLFGVIHGAVYRCALASKGVRRVRYAMLCGMLYVPLFYQILTDQYLSVMATWIQVAFWTWVLTSKFVVRSDPSTLPEQSLHTQECTE